MAAQERKLVRRHQEFPGGPSWPTFAVRCPECRRMSEHYGEVSTEIDGVDHFLCLPCGRKIIAEMDARVPGYAPEVG